MPPMSHGRVEFYDGKYCLSVNKVDGRKNFGQLGPISL